MPDLAAFAKNPWSLAIRFQVEKYKALTPAELAEAIKREDYNPVGVAKHPSQLPVWRKCSECAVEFVSNWTYVGEANSVQWVKGFRDSIVTIEKYQGKTYMAFNGVGIDTVFNTLRTTARSRAANIFEKVVVPAVKKLAGAKSCSATCPVDGYILVVTYGSKDFSKRSDVLNLEAEALLVLAPAQDARQLAANLMDTESFLERCIIFLSDRDAIFEATRVKLRLE